MSRQHIVHLIHRVWPCVGWSGLVVGIVLVFVFVFVFVFVGVFVYLGMGGKNFANG